MNCVVVVVVVVVVFGCGPASVPARSWLQPVTADRVIVRCNDTDTAWTLVCDGHVWRPTSASTAVANCSTTAALTGDTGTLHAYTNHETPRGGKPTHSAEKPSSTERCDSIIPCVSVVIELIQISDAVSTTHR